MRTLTGVLLLFVSCSLFAQREMDNVLASAYKAGGPGAAVIVVKNGQVIYRNGYGMANLELNVPIKPEMVFRLCSVTKQFTAVAIMMLVEQGKLSLDDDVAKFFPEYANRKITVLNLLTHTSGIKDYLEKLWPNNMRQDMRPARIVDLFKNEPLEFEPGTRDSYSNSNYILLGLIIEKVSGQPYGQFIDANIFKPLGMKHSFYEDVQDLIPNRVSGYVKYQGGFLNAPYVSTLQLYAAGAIVSSVDDLALWDAAITGAKLLKRASWDRLFTPYKLAGGKTSPYALGWVISEFQGKTIATHAGGIPGYRAFVMRVPSDGLYVAVLSNDESADEQPEYVAHKLAAIAMGKPAAAPSSTNVDPKSLGAYAGVYQESGDDTFTVRREGNRLFGQDSGNPEVELFPLSADTFVIKAFDATIIFQRDAGGKVTGAIYRFGGQDMQIRKVK